MAAKIFEVGDVLPATTQLRISWTIGGDITSVFVNFPRVFSDSNNFVILGRDTEEVRTFDNTIIMAGGGGGSNLYWVSPFTDKNGNHAYIDLDLSQLSLSERTVSDGSSILYLLYWEDLNASSGYTITFNSNGGTTISDIEEATELPTHLPIPTKSGYKFVAWYYESNFQTRAKAGDTLEANTTLYAKWHNLGTLFTGIANAIRSKDGTSENIRDLDFDDRIRAIEPAKEEETKTITPDFSGGNDVVTPTTGKVLSQVTLTKPTDLLPENIAKDKNVCGVVGTSFIAIELTQAQYDTLGTKDANTYYLIVEVE